MSEPTNVRAQRSDSGSGSRRNRIIAAVVVVLLVVGVAGVVVVGRSRGGSSESATKAVKTAPVTRQDLVDRKNVSGTLEFGDSRQLPARAGGTVTRVASVSTTVGRDGLLWRIDQQPTLLMYGMVPAYRTMSEGDSGPDVRQLNANLSKLGYTGFTVDADYSSGTTDAVASWQDDHGLDGTGKLSLGQVVFAAVPIRVAAVNAEAGAIVAPGAPVLTVTSTERVVSIDLSTGDQSLAQQGATVVVTLPDSVKVNGTITTIGTIATSTSSGTSGGLAASGSGSASTSSTIPVTVTLVNPAAAGKWDSAPVDVAMESSRVTNVLTVPVTALLALSGGGYGVEVVNGAGAQLVAVTTGLFADGRVEVSGDGITEGTLVQVPAT